MESIWYLKNCIWADFTRLRGAIVLCGCWFAFVVVVSTSENLMSQCFFSLFFTFENIAIIAKTKLLRLVFIMSHFHMIFQKISSFELFSTFRALILACRSFPPCKCSDLFSHHKSIFLLERASIFELNVVFSHYRRYFMVNPF